MNEFDIHPAMTRIDLGIEFIRVFPHLKLDVLTPGPATQPLTTPPDATEPAGATGAHPVSVRNTLSVAEFERVLQSRFGLSARVIRRMGYTWHDTDSTRHWTLARQDRKGAEVSQFRHFCNDVR